MFKFNNTHIFTGYLKQLLSSFNLPTCKIYTREFLDYRDKHNGKEDPRVLESFDTIINGNSKQTAIHIPYLKDNELYNYFWNYNPDKEKLNYDNTAWKRVSSVFYEDNIAVPGLTRILNSPGISYDTKTHEHLGNYLRFLRDFYNVDLMSLYNCFNNKICNNVYYRFLVKEPNPNYNSTPGNTKNSTEPEFITTTYTTFDSRDSKYRIYAFPVKLFANYTIAIDSSLGILRKV